MIDFSDYFGPPSEKVPPATEEERIADFKKTKAKLAAEDPAADSNTIVRLPQKKADQAKTVPTKARYLSLAIEDIALLKANYQAAHHTGELIAGSEDHFDTLNYFEVADLAITQLRQTIAHLELDAQAASEPEVPPAIPGLVQIAEQPQFPDQMDAEQVAHYIHRNVDVVYRYAREGRIPAQYIDTHPLFSKKAIDEWLAAHPELDKPSRRITPKK